jgi:NAD-dependent dihydropyrimidine dehydrogenase PreA subunit
MGVPKVDAAKCDGCKECIEECPAEAITLVKEIAVIDPDECTECSACVDTCPNEAIDETD